MEKKLEGIEFYSQLTDYLNQLLEMIVKIMVNQLFTKEQLKIINILKLDDHHTFLKDKNTFLVCGNTWKMLKDSDSKTF